MNKFVDDTINQLDDLKECQTMNNREFTKKTIAFHIHFFVELSTEVKFMCIENIAFTASVQNPFFVIPTSYLSTQASLHQRTIRLSTICGIVDICGAIVRLFRRNCKNFLVFLLVPVMMQLQL